MHVIAAVMPSRHGILTESPPSGPPLPQDLPRTSNQLVSHLQGHKQKQKKKKLQSAAKKSIIKRRTTATTAAGYYSCTSRRQAHGHCPRIYGGFPRGLDNYFHCNVLRPHTSNPWEPLYFGTGPEASCLAVSFLFIYVFFPPPLLLIITCLEIILSERLPRPSRQTV